MPRGMSDGLGRFGPSGRLGNACFQAETGAGVLTPANGGPKSKSGKSTPEGAAVPPPETAPADAAPAQKTPRLSAAAAILGEVVWLLGRSDAHKHLFLTDLDWLVLPPVQLRQFRIWQNDNKPVAFASWAYLTEEAGERFANGARIGRMGQNAPGTRKSGEQLWLIGFVAAVGRADGMIQELREKLFEGRKIKTLQPAPEGSWVGVMEW
jgi:cytolysin-activating lysine-acyltransferase